jgi:HK97 gp10 family phage protein
LASGFTMNLDVFKNVKHLDTKIERAIYGVCKYWDGPVERHMKHAAPWHDRTTNARNGLAARAAKLAKGIYGIILSHAVDYGIYLERGTRYMHARPIINPTIDIYAPKVIAFTTKLLDRLDKQVGGAGGSGA